MANHTPTKLKHLQGTLRPSRRNPTAPEPPPGSPPKPDHLSDRASLAWDLFVELLSELGTLTTSDGPAVEGLCQSYVDWREAVEGLDRHGLTIEIPIMVGERVVGARVRPHPLVSQRNEADRRHRGWLQSCGLTPTDRSKVSAVEEQTGPDPLAEILAIGGGQ